MIQDHQVRVATTLRRARLDARLSLRELAARQQPTRDVLSTLSKTTWLTVPQIAALSAAAVARAGSPADPDCPERPAPSRR